MSRWYNDSFDESTKQDLSIEQVNQIVDLEDLKPGDIFQGQIIACINPTKNGAIIDLSSGRSIQRNTGTKFLVKRG